MRDGNVEWPPAEPRAPRVAFHLLQPEHLPVLHALVRDEHIRRYLLDGRELPESWTRALIETSRTEFTRSKLGIWLVSERGAPLAQAIGFAGFWSFDGVGSAPQLVYALRAGHTGRGYAGEIAAALIDFARAHRALDAVEAAVDEPNLASRRVLQRLGFVACGEAPGAFGTMLLVRLPACVPPREWRTERLLMRPFRDADVAPFARMNADPEVMRHFPAPLTPAESAAQAARLRAKFDAQGYGLWALELPGQVPFLGFTGLGHPSFQSHFTPCVEIGWRLAREHWRQGYALEAARAALHVAFVQLRLSQVVAFTAASNLPSQQLMQRLGMHRDPADDFDHPNVPDGHALQRHVLYRLHAAQNDPSP